MRHWLSTLKVALANYEALREPRLWECYAELPEAVRQLADKNFALLKENPKHPSLHLKNVGATGLRASGRVIGR